MSKIQWNETKKLDSRIYLGGSIFVLEPCAEVTYVSKIYTCSFQFYQNESFVVPNEIITCTYSFFMWKNE